MKDNAMIIFSPAVFNLAETTRCIELAKACRKHFNILFISYGGEFEHLIEKEGFRFVSLEPQITQEKVDHFYKIDQGRKIGAFFTKAEIEEQVKNEITLFKKYKPAAVVTGFNLSNSISCRVAKIPLISIYHTTWMIEKGCKTGYFTYPDMLNHAFLTWMGEKALNAIWLKLFGFMSGLVLRPYNRVSRQYGIQPFKDFEELLRGDYNLLAEPEGFCHLTVPNSHFIGPLIAKLDAPIPKEVLQIKRDKPIVYFAMGSSGQPHVIKKIVEGFQGKPYSVIAPVKSLLKGLDVKIPENVIVTDWLPADKVNPMADVTVIHGGIGTVMTAALAGKPVVGIGMQYEQEVNIDCLVKKGFAIRIRKNEITPERLYAAIERLLNDAQAREKAQAFKEITEKWHAPNIAADFFIHRFGS
jgi:UDP:flavonoid glycosyltransferase YjiC (YdhE family)